MNDNTYQTWESEQMDDPEFRAALVALEPEYQAARIQQLLAIPEVAVLVETLKMARIGLHPYPEAVKRIDDALAPFEVIVDRTVVVKQTPEEAERERIARLKQAMVLPELRERIAMLEAQVTELTAERDGLFAQLKALAYDALSEHGQ